MKQFVTHCLYFVLPVLVALVAIGFLADGYTDPFYLRFTSPRQNALVIGISRTAQGIQPAILNRELQQEYPRSAIYNFSFSRDNSPFGELYFNAIRNKLNKDVTHSFFIIGVDPWSISSFGKDPDDPKQFAENYSFMSTIKWVNMNPNFPYLIKGYTDPYGTVLTRKMQTTFFNDYPSTLLHKDGWLEVTVPMDSTSIHTRMQRALTQFGPATPPNCFISNTRKSYLLKIIAFLKQHGDVYLVRMPVHPAMLALEKNYYAAFDTYIDSIARQQQLPYFNFTDSCTKYTYTDGSHLWKNSGALLTKQLSRLIISYRQSRQHQ